MCGCCSVRPARPGSPWCGLCFFGPVVSPTLAGCCRVGKPCHQPAGLLSSPPLPLLRGRRPAGAAIADPDLWTGLIRLYIRAKNRDATQASASANDLASVLASIELGTARHSDIENVTYDLRAIMEGAAA